MTKKFFTLLAAMFLVLGCSDDPSGGPEPDPGEEKDTTVYSWDELEYKEVDFDSVYGQCSGQTLVNNIKDAISNAADDEMIVFKSTSYDFEDKNLSITQAARLSGIIPSEIDGTQYGAQNIRTEFKNLYYVSISTDNVELYHMKWINSVDLYGFVKLTDSQANQYFNTTTKHRENIIFSNMHLYGATNQIYAGNGTNATFKYMTFEDFSLTGFATNRFSALKVCPKSTFDYCHFLAPKIDDHYNLRGIAFDAGNTDYPAVYDLNGTTMNRCYFDRGGVGFSKCQNAVIKNCYFKGSSYWVDQVHMEEFSCNITITGNTFEHEEPARCFYIDRERQCAHDLTITDNKFVGNIGWIISSYGASNITFTGNDFTDATLTKASDFPYDLDFIYDGSEYDPTSVTYAIPSHNVVIKNNKNLTLAGGMRIIAEEGNNTNSIDISGCEVTYAPAPADVQPLPDGQYTMKNLETGEYLCYGDPSSVYIGLTTTYDETCVWNFKFTAPQNYEITTSDGLYMESYCIYQLTSLQNGSDPGDTLVRKASYASDERAYNYVIQNHPLTGGYDNFWLIYAGGNERRSAIGSINGVADLEYGNVGEDYGTAAEPFVGKTVITDPANNKFMLWEITKID